MKTYLAFHNINEPSRPRLRELFDEHAAAIERRLVSFSPDLVRLEGRVEKNPNHHLYRVALRLKLPSAVLAVAEEAHDLLPALTEAFAELTRRTDKHQAQLERQHLWKRPSRRTQLQKILQAPVDARERNRRGVFYELIESHLDALYAYARRELVYLETVGDLQPGELAAEDVVGTVLVRALENFENRPARLTVREWLLALALASISEELERLRRGRRAVSLEASAPRPAVEPTHRDDERSEFWEPEEYLRLEDLLPDLEALTPEEAETQREMQLALQRAIAMLPRAWRHAVILTTFEGLGSATAAQIMGIEEARLRALLDHAQAFLLEKLAEAGFAAEGGTLPAGAVTPLAAPPLPSAERAAIAQALQAAAR